MFGAFGAGGVILVIIAALVAHKRGNGRLKVVREDHHVVWWGLALGIFASSAGQAFRQVGTVSQTISHAFQSQSTNLGSVGAPAIAAVVVIIAFGTKPRMAKDLICGVAMPGLLSAAGGLWALPITVIAVFLHSLVG